MTNRMGIATVIHCTRGEEMNQPESIAQMSKVVEEIAESMTTVATNVAMLGIQGNADDQMRIITEENDKVLSRIRQLYNLPAAPEQ